MDGDTAEDEILIVVVSDGAGSASRAETGSRLACCSLLEIIRIHMCHGLRVDQIGPETARDWMLTIRSQLETKASEEGVSIRDYACTLLAVIAGPKSAAFLQLGDGAMVVNEGEKGWRYVFWPQKGEFANATYFVTQEDMDVRFSFERIEHRVDELAVFTDGIEPLVLRYADKSVHAPYFNEMFSTVRSFAHEG